MASNINPAPHTVGQHSSKSLLNSNWATVKTEIEALQAGTGIANDAVTFAKLQNIATDRLIGRDAAGTGDAEELTVGGGLEFTGVGGIQRSALTGDVTASAGSGSTTIANDAVIYAKMQNVSAASRLVGRGSAGGAGDPEEITLGSGLTMTGTALSSDAATAATTTAAGIVELATDAEVQAGTDTVRAITPSGLRSLARTRQVFTTGSGTYTTPANTKYIVVRMVGGGGGGSGSGTTPGTGGAGGNTTFSILTASGGGAGTTTGGTSAGGTGTNGDVNITGGAGGPSVSTLNNPGGQGGVTAFGGGGTGGGPGTVGAGATANTGAGGGGGGITSTANTGGGGAAGGYVEKIILSPGASFSYAVGAGGAGGTAGTGGFAAGAGGSGLIIVDEFYS